MSFLGNINSNLCVVLQSDVAYLQLVIEWSIDLASICKKVDISEVILTK